MVKSENDGDDVKTEYRREAAVKEMFGIKLPKDEIGSHLAVSQGFPISFERPMDLDEETDTEDLWDMTEEDFGDDALPYE